MEFTAETARIVMPSGAVTTLDAGAGTLEIGVTAETAEAVEQAKPVIERHLDRFAFREAPLPFAWSV